MKFRVLALDYDGTVAQDGVLNPEVRSAIMDARSRGLIVVLVTGRILSDLRQAAGDLSFLDAVVAENGAVISFPSGTSRVLGQPPPQSFMAELHRRGIQFRVGECVLEADANSSHHILSVIRHQELPLLLLFNRSRLMVLPQSVSKGAGLRAALSALRLSVHNAMGIGDGENDHDLLASCEIGVAVEWGSPVLKASADEILKGDGPSAVAAYLRRTMVAPRLTTERMGHYRMALGNFEDGSPVALPLGGRNLLITGDTKSGKSWVAGLACEQMILQGYSVCVIDPEGDYRALEQLPGVVTLGGHGPPPQLPDVAQALRYPDLSVVICLSQLPHPEKVQYLNALLPTVASIRRATGLPHRIVVDEAHYFLDQSNVSDLLDLTLGAYTLVTYRLSDLHAEVRKAMEVLVVKRTTDPQEIQTLASMVGHEGVESDWKSALETMAINQAALLPGSPEAQGRLRRFELLPRLTTHVRHRTKYLDVQLIAEQAFIFTTDNGTPAGKPARTLKEFCSLLKISKGDVIEGHARRGDFSRWIAGVFRDDILASDVREIEQGDRRGHQPTLADSLVKTIDDRYEFISLI